MREAIPPLPKQEHTFLLDSVALLQGNRTSHMGVHQYVDHKATRYGKPMSGVALWQEIEYSHRAYYIPTAERQMIASLACEVNNHVPKETPFVDLGRLCRHIVCDAAV